MPSFNSNFNTNNLSSDQLRVLTMYINQYNQTNSHIDRLLDMVDEIRGNIYNIINISQPRRNRINRNNRNTNFNRILNQIYNERQNNLVYYDYDNPIDYFIYNDYYINSIPRRYNFDMSFNRINSNNYNNINSETNPNNNDLATFINNFLNSTVPIRPTNEQIQNASRIIRYGDIENPLSESCPISLDEFNINDEVRQLLPCGHIFHQNQFQEWFESNVRCPVCRYDIRNYRPLSRRNTPNTEPTSNTSTTNQSSNSNSNSDSNSISTNNINNESNNQSNQVDTSTTRNVSDNSFSNINVIRNPLSNQIDQLTFDINDQYLTNNLLDRLARNLFQSVLNPSNLNNTDRFMIDPSNNILLYETILRPSNRPSDRQNDDDINNNT